MTRLPTGSLVVTVGASGPHWEGKWRWQGRQHKRRLGRAWLIPANRRDIPDGRPEGSWKKCPGRPQEGFLSERDAYQALTAMIASHAAESELTGQSAHKLPTFAETAEAWYERAQRRQRKPATLLSYRQMIDTAILGRPTKRIPKVCPFKDEPINAVSRRDIQAWLDSLEWSRSKERLAKLVKSIFIYAVTEDWIAKDVAAAVESEIVPYDGGYDFYSVQEVARLIEHADDAHDAALYATAAFAGLRRGELLALQWQDVDFRHSRITVRRNVAAGVMSTPKSAKIRTVPMVPALSARLKMLKLRANRHTTSNHVFANPARLLNGNPWPCPRALERRYKQTLTRADLRPLPFHSLRHHFGSQAVNVATLVQVKAWMGHSSLTTTGRYLHARNLDSDADLLAAAF